MNTEDLTLKQIREIQALTNGKPLPCGDDSHWKVGQNYFLRTVTHHLTGKLIKVVGNELVLLDAAWIADDGRFMEAVKTGTFAEVEPYPDGIELIVNRSSLIDACIIPQIPRSQK